MRGLCHRPAGGGGSTSDDDLRRSQVADPWEPFNRAMFRFNQDLDEGLLYPLSSAYVALVPDLVRLGVTNFFNNAQDLWSAINLLMQGRLEQSVQMSFRFAWNTVYGVAGILDLATELGIERWHEDFGQTLAVWGTPPGNFLMLPFFGPSTVRDAIALPLDIAATPAYAIGEGSFRPVTTVIQILDTRSQLMARRSCWTRSRSTSTASCAMPTWSRRQRLIEDYDRLGDWTTAPRPASEGASRYRVALEPKTPQ